VRIDISSLRDRVGHAPMGHGVGGLLERIVWKTLQFRSLEDDSSMINVVPLKRT
jgi:hypothetical protein